MKIHCIIILCVIFMKQPLYAQQVLKEQSSEADTIQCQKQFVLPDTTAYIVKPVYHFNKHFKEPAGYLYIPVIASVEKEFDKKQHLHFHRETLINEVNQDCERKE